MGIRAESVLAWMCTLVVGACAVDSPPDHRDTSADIAADIAADDADTVAETVAEDAPSVGEVVEIEPNEEVADASRFEVGQTLVGRIETPSDIDVWVARLEKGTLLSLTSLGDVTTELELGFAGTMTIPFMSDELVPTMESARVDAPVGEAPSRIFVPETGDYTLVVKSRGALLGPYRIATAAARPTPVPLPSTVPITLPVTPRQQQVYSFTAPEGLVLTSPWLCPNVDSGGGRWRPGGLWAYHPTDPSVRVVFGAWTAIATYLYGCGVPMWPGKEVYLVSPFLDDGVPVEPAEVSLTELRYDALYPLPIAPGDTFEGESADGDRGNYFALDDPSLLRARVTLELEVEPPSAAACLGLYWFNRYERHGPDLAPLQERAISDPEGRVTLSFIPGLAGLPRGMHAVYVSAGACGWPVDPGYVRGDFRYRLSVTAEEVAFTPLPSDAELAIELDEAEQRRFERAISPATCTYVRGDNLDEPSRPVSLTSNVNGCWEYPDLMACANASSGPTPMLLGVSMEDGMPGEARLSVASPLIVPSAATPVADGSDNGVGGTPQRLVPPVAVSLGDVSELSRDYFTVALETDDVVLVTVEPTVPMDPTCAWHFMHASLRKRGVSETLRTCVVFPDLPLWNAWDVSNVWGAAGRVSVVSFRAPTSMEVELEIVRGGECASLPPATFHVQVLPGPGASPR